jgi:hypothetical protein
MLPDPGYRARRFPRVNRERIQGWIPRRLQQEQVYWCKAKEKCTLEGRADRLETKFPRLQDFTGGLWTRVAIPGKMEGILLETGLCVTKPLPPIELGSLWPWMLSLGLFVFGRLGVL